MTALAFFRWLRGDASLGDHLNIVVAVIALSLIAGGVL
jgi:hypothetical protein